MGKSFHFALLFLIAFAFAVPQVPLLNAGIGVATAEAQQKRKTLFDVLFKRRKNKKKRATRNLSNSRPAAGLPGVRLGNRKQRQSGTEQNVAGRPAASSAPKPAVVVVKNENAAKILVVGDFMASSLAKGLERQYSENPNIEIVNKTTANSGIVRNDIIDWSVVIPGMIEEIKPIAVVALVGMNDRQKIRQEGRWLDKLSPDWNTAYKDRITKISSSTATAQLPFFWVGLPPVRFGKMNTDYLVFNEMYRSTTESKGGTFVDVWDGFTNAEGKYVSAGPDINGQIVRLRGSKGINMTRAGRRKLAFFVDKSFRKVGLLNDADNAAYASLGTINLGSAQPTLPQYDPAGTGKTVVISLGSPALDGGDALEGAEGFLKEDDNDASNSYDLVANGKLQEPRSGRIDSDWGLPQTAKSDQEKPDVAKAGQVEPARPEEPVTQ